MTEVRIPDFGDFKDVEIIEVLVAAGQTIELEDGLITLETDKTTMDVPSSAAGTITSLKVKVGDKVNIGDLIAVVDENTKPTSAEPAPTTTPPPAAPVKQATADASPPQSDAPPTGASTQSVTVVIPDIGDFKDVEIIEVLVSPGQQVSTEDDLITLETDKATVSVPTTAAGTVEKILVQVGNKVNMGDHIAIIQATAEPSAPKSDAEGAKTTPAPLPASATPTPSVPPPSRADTSSSQSSSSTSSSNHVHASPAVRKIAREFGVDLKQVKGSGKKQRVLKEDIQEYVKKSLANSSSGGNLGLGIGYELPAATDADYSKFGPIEIAKLTRIRKISGPFLHRNWLGIPHITQFDDTDVTELEKFRKEHANEAKAQGFSLSPLAFLVKAVTVALQHYPNFNSSLQTDGSAIILKKYYNIGIAVDTTAGLVVPVIKDTNTKPVMQIAEEMSALSTRAREGKLGPNELKGGTFTISSLGSIGGSHFTPIVNAPEVAILGVGRSRMQPVWDGTAFQPRLMMPLALSYDHRVVDGAQGAHFISHLSVLLSDIRNIVL